MEADLARFYGLDYRDRWRVDERGLRRLTLRMIYVRVQHLPHDSALARALGGPGWSVTDYLTAHVYGVLAGKAHPALPKQSTLRAPDPAHERLMSRARRRARRRQRAIDAGDIT